MKTDWNSLRSELSRLTDTRYLKKELNRIAAEVKKFDVQSRLNPQAMARLEKLEQRFQDLLKTLKDLQKQVDRNLDGWLKMLSKKGFGGAKASATKRSAKKKSAPRKPATPKTGKKTAKRK